MNFDKPAENLPIPDQSSNEELPKASKDLLAVPDSKNAEQVQEKSIEEEMAGMSDANLLSYHEQMVLNFTAARVHHESLMGVVGKDTEYVLALASAKRIQKAKSAAGRELVKRKLEVVTPEYIPKPEEILKIMSQLTVDKAKEVRRKEDDNGLCLLEVKVVGDQEGEFAEYTYRRSGSGGANWVNEIDVVYYMDEQPTSGDLVAKHEDGAWVIL